MPRSYTLPCCASFSAADRVASVMAFSAPTSSSLPQIQPQPVPRFQPLLAGGFCPDAKCKPATQPIATSITNTINLGIAFMEAPLVVISDGASNAFATQESPQYSEAFMASGRR